MNIQTISYFQQLICLRSSDLADTHEIIAVSVKEEELHFAQIMEGRFLFAALKFPLGTRKQQ